MPTINAVKELPEADTPLLVFECKFPSGDVERWSTHTVSVNGQRYLARVLRHNLFDLQLSTDDAMDGTARLSLTLGNADSVLSEIASEGGWKGTLVTAYLVFANLGAGAATTEALTVFQGVAGEPDEITEDQLRITFTNKLNLQRLAVPEVRIQRLCPWSFPTTLAQRTEGQAAVTGSNYSKFARCGYSPDLPNGLGNLNGTLPFSSCDHSRAQCEGRGMFDADSSNRTTRRFGGVEFVPSSTLVRTHGEKGFHQAPVLENSAKYNDAVPLVYGTGWLRAPVILSRNDGNLTHVEVLVGSGKVQDVLKVVVNSVEIPVAQSGINMQATGWYRWVSKGDPQGTFNSDFSDAIGHPLGDPYGSLAVLYVVVPNNISDGRSLPTVEMLVEGQQLDQYGENGTYLGTSYSNNPAWILLDLLRRSGWPLEQINLPSFAASATYCGELISTTDIHGNAIQIPRYQCNLLLIKRKSAAEVIRGVRNGAGLMLRYGLTGSLELLPETTLAQQHPVPPDGTNSVELLIGGWPAYEFSDGSGPFSGIVRAENGSSTVRLVSRSLAETANRLSLEFQDEANEYQQDSLSLVDIDDSTLIGYELASQSTALGIPNMNQASRVLQRQLDKLTRGNRFIEFQTSFRALKIRPGDLITVTYAKENLSRQLYRVIKLTPTVNYRRVTILAQLHDDNWYRDDTAGGSAGGRQSGAAGQLPRPLVGTIVNPDGTTQLGVSDQVAETSGGLLLNTLTVSFQAPVAPLVGAATLPLLSLAPGVASTGGTLTQGAYYYAISALDSFGREGGLSFTARATIGPGVQHGAVTLTNIGLPPDATGFNVYRGYNPQQLLRIYTSTAPANVFVDKGWPSQPAGPPDASFDHANLYYRAELAGPWIASSQAANQIGNADMGSTPQAYIGKVAQIISGRGAGQERQIIANDTATLTVSPGWATVPDATSEFVIVEPSWRFGALATTSPAQFQVVTAAGTVMQIAGRAANALNEEASFALAPRVRFALGSRGAQEGDQDSPPPPSYTLHTEGQGTLILTAVNFSTLMNTRSITAGALQVWYWDELAQPNAVVLSASIDNAPASATLAVSQALASPGDVIQIDSELMTVLMSDAATNTYTVQRSTLGSAIGAHAASVQVLHLKRKVFVTPFAPQFFSNRAAQNFTHVVQCPDVRVAAADYWVTNSFGDSPTMTQCFTATPDRGLRTLYGGQLSVQVGGSLAVQQNAAPALFIDASHPVKDVRATLGGAATGAAVLVQLRQNSSLWCQLTIAPGSTASDVLDGALLQPVTAGSLLGLDIVQVGTGPNSTPGRDLTVTIRL